MTPVTPTPATSPGTPTRGYPSDEATATTVLAVGDGWTIPPGFLSSRIQCTRAGLVELRPLVVQATPGGAGSPIVTFPEAMPDGLVDSFQVRAHRTAPTFEGSYPVYVHLGVDGALRTGRDVRAGHYLLVYAVRFPTTPTASSDEGRAR